MLSADKIAHADHLIYDKTKCTFHLLVSDNPHTLRKGTRLSTNREARDRS